MDIYSELYLDEGFRQFPYTDSVGVLTVGIGRNLEKNGISKEEAMILLHNDVDRVKTILENWPIYRSLNEARQNILINMAFNLGTNGLLKFKNMLSALERRDYENAAGEMMNSLWSIQVGARAVRLAKRMETGEY